MSRRYGTSIYCIVCRLRYEACVCEDAPRLNIATRLFLFIHSSEWRRVGNTGHLIRSAVCNAGVRVHGRPHQPVGGKEIDAASPSTLVLFPGCGATPLTAAYLAPLAQPITLLIPDGNWNQTKRMMARLPMLRRARPVRLQGPSLDLRCVRRNHDSDRRSTFEAIAQSLGVIEGREIEGRMIDFFRLVLSRKSEYGIPAAEL